MTIARMLRTASRKTAVISGIALCLTLGCVSNTYAGDREQAWRIYERLTGTPPTTAMLDQMTACIQGSTYTDGAGKQYTCSVPSEPTFSIGTQGQVNATYLAMQDPNFLGVVVKHMVIPWTNKDQTVFFPLNDAAATLIGMIRDGIDFRTALSANIIYYDPDPNAPPYDQFVNKNSGTGTGDSSDPDDNGNYVYIEHNNKDMQSKSNLVEATQSTLTGMPAQGVAGVLTTRAMQRAFFYAGTNRAMLRFTFLNFLGSDLTQLKDFNSNPDRIRRDPTRSPGGSSNTFLHFCIGCHSGMDGLDGAYAYYNWGPAVYDPNADPDTQSSTYTGPPLMTQNSFTLSGVQIPPTSVMPKYLQNFTSFPDGYVTTDDSWINYWRTGVDANLGWGWSGPNNYALGNPAAQAIKPGQGMGNGMASLGQELADTYAFAQWQAIDVYRHVCMDDPTPSTLSTMVDDFKASLFKMKTLFSEAAIDCTNNLN